MRHFLLKNGVEDPILTKNINDTKVSQKSYLLSLILAWKLYCREKGYEGHGWRGARFKCPINVKLAEIAVMQEDVLVCRK